MYCHSHIHESHSLQSRMGIVECYTLHHTHHCWSDSHTDLCVGEREKERERERGREGKRTEEGERRRGESGGERGERRGRVGFNVTSTHSCLPYTNKPNTHHPIHRDGTPYKVNY